MAILLECFEVRLIEPGIPNFGERNADFDKNLLSGLNDFFQFNQAFRFRKADWFRLAWFSFV
jgi:hypothetical protein